jgi:DNA-binding GntR family transcriptional regulator
VSAANVEARPAHRSSREEHPGLEADRALLDRTSTAERVADILRSRIAEGFFPPGSRLTEESIGDALRVSRNTLREAFRLLTHERLVEHQLNRGMFVRMLSMDDVVDLYRVRKLVECAAVRAIDDLPRGLHMLTAAVVDGEHALDSHDWQALGTADIVFHQALAALANSPRVDELMRGVLAELRLAWHVMPNRRHFHEPYLTRNREILDRLEAGDRSGAEGLLAKYLDDAQRQLVAAYSQRADNPAS